MAPKLASVVAIEKGVKQRANKNLGDAHKTLQKVDLFKGMFREYAPIDDEDTDKLPSETKPIIARVDELMAGVADEFAQLWNVTATKDMGNTAATADVVVDDQVLIAAAPVPYLLFMEKQLRDVVAIISDIPVLDANEEWSIDTNTNLWKSKPLETMRTKKVPKSHVLYEATTEHPAQVQVFTEDINVGRWTRVASSSAIPPTIKKDLVDRAEKVLDAIKSAREEANAKEIPQQKVAAPVLNWILQPLAVEIND